MSTLTLLLAMMLFILKLMDNIGCQGDIGETKAKSESAKLECMSRDYFHVRQSDARSPRLYTTTQLPIATQSLLNRKYTPWIAYRGCYQISTLSTNQHKDHLMVHNNTVGNCYWECKMKAMRSNHCESNANVLFGLHMSHCFCFCNAPIRSDLDQSNRCNLTCSPSSFEDGECGGQDHFSAYEEYEHQGRSLPGLCLICLNISSIIIICGSKCGTNATGFCVSDDSLNSPLPFNGTFNSYWNNCKMKNRHITGNTDIVCQETVTWTGIRKYNIDADYQITITPATVGSIYSPSNNHVVIIIGVSGTILAICFVVFLLLYKRVLLRSCEKNAPRNVENNNVGHTTFSNTSGHTKSKTDSDPHHVYHTIVPETRNYQLYDHIQNTGQENNQYIIVL